jgi:hypothetical protein
MSKKLGSDFAKEMLQKGLQELREIGHFTGSNIAQANTHTTDREQAAVEPETAPDRAPEIERER